MGVKEDVGYGYIPGARVTCGTCSSGHFSSLLEKGPGLIGSCLRFSFLVRYEHSCTNPTGLKPPVAAPAQPEQPPATATGS